jgi:hypothetical protein
LLFYNGVGAKIVPHAAALVKNYFVGVYTY